MPTIKSVMEDINVYDRSGGIFLPYIQRGFVWDDSRIYKLLDSVMRRYPIGTFLAWSTAEPMNYREFVTEADKDMDYDALTNPPDAGNPQKKKYVLDGQQRLQSFYLALNGTYRGKKLYFNLLSNPETPEEEHEFKFVKPGDPLPWSWKALREILDSGSAGNAINKLDSERFYPNRTAQETHGGHIKGQFERFY